MILNILKTHNKSYTIGIKVRNRELFEQSNIIEVNVGTGAEVLSSYVFYNCKYLEKVTLPEGLKGIGHYAFYGCKKLTTINLPESLTTIGESAFAGAFDAESDVKITIPKNIAKRSMKAGEWLLMKKISAMNTVRK